MNRVASIDICRFVAICAVVVIHMPTYDNLLPDVERYSKFFYVILNQAARFAVPFFFVISGYFWGYKARQNAALGEASRKMLYKLLLIYVVWSLIYLIPYNLLYENNNTDLMAYCYAKIRELASDPSTLILQGTKIHLWFLASLLMSMGLCHVFIASNYFKTCVTVALLLYIFGLITRAYVTTPIGIKIDFNTRNGPFSSMLPFITGYWLSAYTPKHKWLWLGVIILALGCLLHITEILLIWKRYAGILTQDQTLGTYFMGVGVSLMALSNKLGEKRFLLHRLGKLALGIYLVHPVFIDFLHAGIMRFAPPETIYSVIIIYVIGLSSVVFLSVVTTLGISRLKLTRVIVGF